MHCVNDEKNSFYPSLNNKNTNYWNSHYNHDHFEKVSLQKGFNQLDHRYKKQM